MTRYEGLELPFVTDPDTGITRVKLGGVEESPQYLWIDPTDRSDGDALSSGPTGCAAGDFLLCLNATALAAGTVLFVAVSTAWQCVTNNMTES